MRARRKTSRTLIAPEVAPSSEVRESSGISAVTGSESSIVSERNESPRTSTTKRAKTLTAAHVPEAERQWRRDQVLQVLAEILRNPAPANKH